MKRYVCFVLIALAAAGTSFAGSPLTPEPRATFEKITVDYKASENGVTGMMLHLIFTCHDMKDMDAFVAVYFDFNDTHGGILKDKNKKFVSSAGDVALYKAIKPTGSPETFEDFQLFMPYDELDLGVGDFDLSMDIKIIKKEGGAISKLTTYDFNFRNPPSDGGLVPSAALQDLRIDHNVTQNGKVGMLFHAKFTVDGMKGVDAYIAIYFERKDGTKLTGLTNEYKSSSGQSAGYKLLSLTYDNSIYDDLQLFVPYEELNLGTGKHALRLDADIIYKNGNLMKHLKLQEFQVEL